MSGEEVLLTLGEVGVAVAGFSGIVAVFGRRSSVWSPVESFRVVYLVVSAAAVGAFSFLPFALQQVGLSAPWVWGSSSLAFVLFAVGLLSWALVKGRQLLRAHREEVHLWLFPVGTSLAAVAVALQLLNLSGVVFARELGPFLAGVVLLLFTALLQFCVIVFAGLHKRTAA